MSIARLIPLDRNDPTVTSALRESVLRLSKIEYVRHVYLFGSFASGLQTAESDLDLAVIVNNDVRLRDATIQVRRALRNIGWPMDLLVIPQNIYDTKSQIGGVCFDVCNYGVELFPNWQFI